MHRWTLFIGAIMLVLVLWTGGATHAAVAFDCSPATSEVVAHMAGDQDQIPSRANQDFAHHHSGCNGHFEVASTGTVRPDFRSSGNVLPLASNEAGKPGHNPEAQLRPPRA